VNTLGLIKGYCKPKLSTGKKRQGNERAFTERDALWPPTRLGATSESEEDGKDEGRWRTYLA
jgi:hypothetical protein